MPLFPETLLPARVQVTPLHAQAVNVEPTSFEPQVYDWGGRAWLLRIEMQPMDVEDAALMAGFLHELEGAAGFFLFDLDPWCPGVSPPPGWVSFRLATTEPGWRSSHGVTWSFALEAIESDPGWQGGGFFSGYVEETFSLSGWEGGGGT